jgi:hypothetical protein
MEPEGSLHCTQEPDTCPCPEPQFNTRLCEMFRKLLSFYGEELSSLAQPPSWGTTPCRLSVTHYLPSISGGLLLHPWIISLIVCFGLVPNAGNFLRIDFFRGLLNNISSSVSVGMYCAVCSPRPCLWLRAVDTYTHTHDSGCKSILN